MNCNSQLSTFASALQLAQEKRICPRCLHIFVRKDTPVYHQGFKYCAEDCYFFVQCYVKSKEEAVNALQAKLFLNTFENRVSNIDDNGDNPLPPIPLAGGGTD